jgi:alpha-galactosidase
MICLSLAGWLPVFAQSDGAAISVKSARPGDSVIISGDKVRVVFHRTSGKVDYQFASGVSLNNTVASVTDVQAGYLCTAGYRKHSWNVERFRDSLGKGIRIRLTHTDERYGPVLEQLITLYEDRPFLLLGLQVHAGHGGPAQGSPAQGGPTHDGPAQVETRDICPLAILPGQDGILSIPGSEPRILDVPFDNDDWVNDVERSWPAAADRSVSHPSTTHPSIPERSTPAPVVSGLSYELSAVYDNASMSGIVLGSLSHDFWKTGIAYRAATVPGMLDSLKVFGGAATEDNPSLPADYGGKDGTHDLAPHGTMRGETVSSPLIYISALRDVREAFMEYGNMNARMNGRLSWKGPAPVYWNSFGVEDVLGARHVMMPPDVNKISDFIYTLDHFNRYAKPVLSIDSYDQGIYSTAVLDSIGLYGAQRNQQMGFYFIPFAEWTWKSSIDQGFLHGTHTALRDVVLRDKNGQPIQYKTGDFGAYALDPTHPAVREAIITQLEKARAIHARFLKIDFLTAGALESTSRYDTSVRSGMQAYSRGMKMLKRLIDSILGPDIFITQAISPMFPNQYAHTRFVSTDVYSHLRGDEPGFPGWGSTEASLATGSHMWWEQGTLWPFTNLDVIIMQHFQKNPDLTEREVRVRLYAMVVMGSILGDGSDFRQPMAQARARTFLNNPRVCAWFSHPEAFTPLKWADGSSLDQRLVFYRKGDTAMLAQFNFSNKEAFADTFYLRDLGLAAGRYDLVDFLTDKELGTIREGQASFSLSVPEGDAVLVRIVPRRNARQNTQTTRSTEQ